MHGLWAVIHERGFDGVSFRTVAEAAGVSPGRIQHYFRSKDDLVHEGCARMVDLAREGHESRSRGSDPATELRDLVAAPIPCTREERLGAAVWYAYLARSTSDDRIAEIVVAALQDSRGRAVRLLRGLRPGRPDEARDSLPDRAFEQEAVALLALGDGLAQRAVLGALDGEQARQLLDEELARRGLSPLARPTGR